MINKNKVAAVLLSIFLLISLAGCQPTSKKPTTPPQVKKAPEVAKYTQEPTISLYRTATGATQNLKLEQYLKGVVAAEIGPKFPMEALKAQAIVARTMTLALLEYENGTRGKHNTDASDDHTEFQAYDETKITDNISKAVEATRGEVLTYNGKFAYALFHAASKDKTASITEGFPKLAKKAPYLVPVDTNGLKNAPAKYKNWTVKIPRSEVQAIMGSKAGSLNDIHISKKGPSGRAMTISAGQASISAVDLREKVGFDRLYSTALSSVKAEGNYIVFRGNAWGHGVGMEQWGTYTMAKEGKNARQIVEHYYPKTMWTKLYK
ncbi:MAG: SpoIID/LytB domain-containing protein [Syntrophomonadaceae bacterium]|nr:SpoIID/LytB domain-containing protein [Syntrophomonadaceae bacterium]MDD4549106.1 SpoIID/LytB domain-containing protein [Syntrophomonadaceae bacterium]